MQSKKIFGIIISVAVVLILVGMIVATALISKSDAAEWEYVSSDEKINYDNSPDDTEFQHAENFRHSIEAYFSSIFKGFLSSSMNLDKYIEKAMSAFSNKLVNAMGEARISSAKLNRISKAIDDNSVEAIFAKIKNEISKVSSLEELEKNVAAKVNDMTFLGFVGDIITGFMRETTLTENEIAEVIYYYYKQNGDEKYVEYLNLVGKDFLTTLLTDTIYALSTLNAVSVSDYQLEATAGTVKTILYQLGSVYTGVSALSGGGATMEKILGWTWSYGEEYKNADKLNEYVKLCNGKTGDLFGVIGFVMKELSTEDVSAVLSYRSASDEKEKSDKKIVAAASLAKCIDRAFPSIKSGCLTEFESVEGMAKTYSEVSKNLGELAFAVLDEYQTEKTEEDTPEDYTERFDNFISGYEVMRNLEMGYADIEKMNSESDEYKNLKAKADEFFEIEEGLISILGNVVSVKISNLSFAFMGAETTK